MILTLYIIIGLIVVLTTRDSTSNNWLLKLAVVVFIPIWVVVELITMLINTNNHE